MQRHHHFLPRLALREERERLRIEDARRADDATLGECQSLNVFARKFRMPLTVQCEREISFLLPPADSAAMHPEKTHDVSHS